MTNPHRLSREQRLRNELFALEIRMDALEDSDANYRERNLLQERIYVVQAQIHRIEKQRAHAQRLQSEGWKFWEK